MERLGMVVDVSHLNDRGMEELLGFAGKPFAASHSNARAALHGQQCAKLPSVQSRFQLRNGAAGREAAPTGIRLPVKTGGPMVKERIIAKKPELVNKPLTKCVDFSKLFPPRPPQPLEILGFCSFSLFLQTAPSF